MCSVYEIQVFPVCAQFNCAQTGNTWISYTLHMYNRLICSDFDFCEGGQLNMQQIMHIHVPDIGKGLILTLFQYVHVVYVNELYTCTHV